MSSIYDIAIESVDGNPLNMRDFEGKKLMVVNVASECGYTPQYALLQDLYTHFNERLTVLACPCNDFGGQEPKSEAEVANFCRTEFGVTFPISKKINIIQDEVHPLYQWLTQRELNGAQDSQVNWNFQKYLINEDGTLYDVLPSSASPIDETVMHWIGAN